MKRRSFTQRSRKRTTMEISIIFEKRIARFSSLKLAFLALFLIFENSVAVEVVPNISEWDYSYQRCDAIHSGNPNEHEAALAGALYYYNGCNDALIVDEGKWGAFGDPV